VTQDIFALPFSWEGRKKNMISFNLSSLGTTRGIGDHKGEIATRRRAE